MTWPGLSKGHSWLWFRWITYCLFGRTPLKPNGRSGKSHVQIVRTPAITEASCSLTPFQQKSNHNQQDDRFYEVYMSIKILNMHTSAIICHGFHFWIFACLVHAPSIRIPGHHKTVASVAATRPAVHTAARSCAFDLHSFEAKLTCNLLKQQDLETFSHLAA